MLVLLAADGVASVGAGGRVCSTSARSGLSYGGQYIAGYTDTEGSAHLQEG